MNVSQDRLRELRERWIEGDTDPEITTDLFNMTEDLIAERDRCKAALEKLDAVLDFSEELNPNGAFFFEDPFALNEAFDFAYSLLNPLQHAVNNALEGADTQ